MPAVAERTREERITEYVVRDALADVFETVTDGCRTAIDVVRGDNKLDVQQIVYEVSSALLCELWPDDEDMETEEYGAANDRARSLTIAILAQMAAGDFREGILDEITRLELLKAKA